MDEGPAGGHLSVRALHGDAYRLFRAGQEGAVVAQQGDELRVQGRDTILWMKGGFRIYVSGDEGTYEYLKSIYCAGGEQAFD